jgi:cobalamin biosynthesis Co2+ chelatase CbiK
MAIQWSTIINKIKKLDETDDSYIDKYEDLLEKLSDIQNPKLIVDLFDLFDDNFEYDEVMYSIIHIAESFDDIEYSKYVLQTLPKFIYKSPKWASIVHMRILNSESTLIEYIKVCINATREQKKSIKKLIDAINEEDSSFLIQTIPLLGVLD